MAHSGKYLILFELAWKKNHGWSKWCRGLFCVAPLGFTGLEFALGAAMFLRRV